MRFKIHILIILNFRYTQNPKFEMERTSSYTRILTIIIVTCVCVGVKAKIVRTPSGSVLGTTSETLGVNVSRYYKIPFATPPIGNFRFTKTVPVVPWGTTINSTKYGPSCVQSIPAGYVFIIPNQDTSEDCLHLNIFVPETNIASNQLKPVMVWIHGGAFVVGSATMYDGSYLAAQGDVIVVTVNYRLGILGFLSFGNLRGNYGLWDQLEAIRWIKRNIRSFGGDPSSITIFGESAGAASVALHSTIPRNRGLFQRSIMQSGSYSNPWTFGINMVEGMRQYTETVGCNDDGNRNVESCLM